MAKILATTIRAGMLIEWKGKIWRVSKCYHIHVGGRGGAYMQVEMKDIDVGTKVNQRFRTDEKVEKVTVDVREMNFLYKDNDLHHFVDSNSYEEITIENEFLEEQTGYLLPDTRVQINFYNNNPIGIQLPPSVVLTVVDTDPNIKGATITTSFKPAILETGIQVMVPPFVERNEKIKINTDTGEYVERILS
jgi:elongation factor P